ncbi:hypothetical protein RhiTH_001548 [Rhizoctonia solani]|uniref:F-box domain-containing protein n=1 Tax=Rhizoctonia solani TaxID=456999 RepID=A0A8H7LGF0_9AGAM|nr:hypothetical protein RHS04_05991 [Rhizoctonia solani]
MDSKLKSIGYRLEAALSQYLDASLAVRRECINQTTAGPVLQNLRLTGQLDEAVLLEQKIQRARVAISFARNASPSIVPIHRLPPDLLAKIFLLFPTTESCILDSGARTVPQEYPICVSHVCTHWRQIAISLPQLWIHIDITATLLKNSSSLSRIETFLSRSGKSQLELHVQYAYEDHAHDRKIDPSLEKAVAPLIPRIRRLRCDIPFLSYDTDPVDSISRKEFSLSVLSQFLNTKATPGTLDALEIWLTGTINIFSIYTNEQLHREDALRLDMPAQHLEDLLFPVTTLRLTRCFPDWTSKAFHNLNELRLCAFHDNAPLNESQLLVILASSPQLRVLELQIELSLLDIAVPPVALHSLETLITHARSFLELGRLLRLLDTGSSPIFMTIYSPFNWYEQPDENIVHFFSRSNVTRLCAEEFNNFYKPFELVNLSPTVKKFAITPPTNDSWEFYGDYRLPIQVCLDTLYLLHDSSDIDIGNLQRALEWSGIRRLVTWGSFQETTRDTKPIKSKRLLRDELSSFGPILEMLPTCMPCPKDTFLL